MYPELSSALLTGVCREARSNSTEWPIFGLTMRLLTSSLAKGGKTCACCLSKKQPLSGDNLCTPFSDFRERTPLRFLRAARRDEPQGSSSHRRPCIGTRHGAWLVLSPSAISLCSVAALPCPFGSSVGRRPCTCQAWHHGACSLGTGTRCPSARGRRAEAPQKTPPSSCERQPLGTSRSTHRVWRGHLCWRQQRTTPDLQSGNQPAI